MHHQHAVVTLKIHFGSQHPLGCLETGTAYGVFGWVGDGAVGHGMQPCSGVGGQIPALALRIFGQCCCGPEPNESCSPRLLLPLTYPCRLLLCDFFSAGQDCPISSGQTAAVPCWGCRCGLWVHQPFTSPPQPRGALQPLHIPPPLAQMVAGVSLWLLLLGPAAGGLCSNTGSAGQAQWENKGPLAGDLSLFSPVSFSDAFISSK